MSKKHGPKSKAKEPIKPKEPRKGYNWLINTYWREKDGPVWCVIGTHEAPTILARDATDGQWRHVGYDELMTWTQVRPVQGWEEVKTS